MSASLIRVENPGLLTTVQDLGRPGYAHDGISASGAADPLALRIGNLLVGNPEGAAALEMTLSGGWFYFEDAATVALAGSDLGIAPWRAFEVRAGETLRLSGTQSGARCYLCVRGGIEVPLVLGSASTHLVSGIGGHQGRALRKGDALRIGGAAIRPVRDSVDPPRSRGPLRVTAGPQADWFGGELYGAPFHVAESSNRMGIRLAGPEIVPRISRQLLTEGAPLGAVQAPPKGGPIILFVEHQTTGGYPKIANVISADLWRVGQLRPRDEVVFQLVTIEEALAALREQEEWLRALV